MGTRESPAAAAPGSPPALRPAAAAPARLMRQQQDEAPRERRGHPGGSGTEAGRECADGEAPPGNGERRDGGWGWGAGVPALVPAGSRGAGSPLAPAARSAPAAGSGGAATAGSPPLTLALAPRPLSHTHAHTHSLTHSAIHSNRKAAPHNSRYLLGERRREGTRGTRPRLSQKRREGSGCLRPSRLARSAVGVRRRRGPHREGRGDLAGWPQTAAAAGRTTWAVPTVTGAPDYKAQNAQAAAVAAPSATPPRRVAI